MDLKKRVWKWHGSSSDSSSQPGGSGWHFVMRPSHQGMTVPSPWNAEDGGQMSREEMESLAYAMVARAAGTQVSGAYAIMEMVGIAMDPTESMENRMIANMAADIVHCMVARGMGDDTSVEVH